jgi:hypothetical protein
VVHTCTVVVVKEYKYWFNNSLMVNYTFTVRVLIQGSHRQGESGKNKKNNPGQEKSGNLNILEKSKNYF